MKKKINMFLLSVGGLTIFLTMLFSVIAFYELFKTEVFNNLKTYSNVLENTNIVEKLEDSTYQPVKDNLRITIISKDGIVTYDNQALESEMDNHSDRPEVIEAISQGEGMAIRTSSTMNINTFYYAKKIPDGTIIRVAKEASSIWSVYIRIIPLMFVMGVGLFSLCMIISHFLVKSFVAPIEQLANNMDDCTYTYTYKELVPFINTINKQHEDILKNAILRQEFTANVSHELKTPLTSISGYAELIENGMTNEEDVARFASEIHRNSNRLLTIINDIIRLSELDVTDIHIQVENIDLYDTAKSCVSMLQVNADKNNVSIHLTGEHCIVRANKVMMEELVYNLCDNAIRYNVKDGEVHVTVSQQEDQVILSVKDNGIGISKENQERIFERFYRVDKSRSKSTGGTGLGLAIVKHIVSQHDAKMELISEIGVGTEIKVIFHQTM